MKLALLFLVACVPAFAGTIYVNTTGVGPNGVYFSLDEGATWPWFAADVDTVEFEIDDPEDNVTWGFWNETTETVDWAGQNTLQAGEYDFDGETWTLVPPSDPAGLQMTVADQLEWWVYGFLVGSIPCSVALMISLFRRTAGGGTYEN